MVSGLMRRLVNDRAFTLIEAMVSITVLSITATGIYSTVILANRFAVDARRVTEATNLTRMILEEVADNPGSENFQPPDTGLPNASWQVEYLDSIGNAILETAIPATDPLTIRVTVFWRESPNSRERSVQLSTRVAQGAI